MSQSQEEVAELEWVKALRPIGLPVLEPLLTGRPLKAWHVTVEFQEWPVPERLAERWTRDKKAFEREAWRKNPLVVGQDSGCNYSCGEVEIAARLRNAEFEAIWMSEWWSYAHVPEWECFCVKRNEFKSRARDSWQADQVIREAATKYGIALGGRGGHPDVVARGGDSGEFIYVEYKGPGDEIILKQYDWARALYMEHPEEVRYVVARGMVKSSV